MKHLMTLVALLVSTAAVAQIPWPYNPDSDGDNLIAIEDLMTLLSVYNTEFFVELPAPSNSPFTLGLIRGDENVITYTDCLRYCAMSGGHIINTTELSLFESTIQSNPWLPTGSGTSNGVPWHDFSQQVYGFSESELGVGYRKEIRIYPDGFNQVAPGDTVWSAWSIVGLEAYFASSYPNGIKGGDCYCSGVVENSNFGE